MNARLLKLTTFLACFTLHAQEQNMPPALAGNAKISPMQQFYIGATRVVWKSEKGVTNEGNLLKKDRGQSLLQDPIAPCVLTGTSGIILDFGVEIQGSVEIFTPMTKENNNPTLRVRMGESVMECLTPVGAKGATNDHAIRDQVITLPWLGNITVGRSGFRFCLLEAADPTKPVQISEVRAIASVRNIPYLGSFRCNDEKLNKIWATGAWTVHVNMQDYLWDGIKRDRLVWIGDMHPEVSTISVVFGNNECVSRSLDLTRDVTPVSEWMNGISSYSMWWILIHEQWYMNQGDLDYLKKQQPYMQALLTKLCGLVGADGKEKIDGMRFLDWPSSPNKQGVTAGLQALLTMTLDSGARMMTTLGDTETAKKCQESADRARVQIPDMNGSKSAAALLSLAGMVDAKKIAQDVLLPNGSKGVSTFYGFYVLQAMAKAGETDAALEVIRNYWGAMIDRGATTFWEDFNAEWLENSGRIDEVLPAGKKDIHGDFGAYCYENFRHSLCHGWASGPTAWMSQNLLGITPAEPGFSKVYIRPQLGNLKWVEGSYPTPHGVIKVRHERNSDGGITSFIDLPPGVKQVP
jgi:alpha-L-rhamnosidase